MERRTTRRVVAARASPVGVEVPLQRHGAHGETGGVGCTVEIAHGVEAPVLMVHESIEGIGGTMGTREAIGARELGAFAAEFEDHGLERAFWEIRRDPLTQTAQPLGELRPGAGVIDFPYPVQNELARGVLTPTAFGDLQDRVQETQEHTSRREEALPGTLRAFPAVGAHRRGAVGGRKGVRLLGTFSVSRLQRVGRGRIGHGRAEDAAASHRGRDIHLVSQRPGVLLVGEHMRREFLGMLDGAAHDGRSSQGQLRPIPVHRIASEHGDQGVEGHTPVAQREGLFHGRGPPHHIGHEERRPDQEHLGSGLERKAPQHDLLLDGPARIMQHEALVDAGGKQLRMLAADRRQMLAETLRIGHARGVVLFTIERHTDTLSSGWFHGSASLYGAVYSIHSIGRGVESSYGLHSFFTNHEIRWNQQYRIWYQYVMRQKYIHHYRQMLPWVLEHLTFRSENRFQPVIEALDVIKQSLGMKGQYFPEAVPLDGVVLPSWRDTVIEKQDDQVQINRQYYELCVLQRLERALKCKEVWVEGAQTFRNPSQDMPANWQDARQRTAY